MTQLSQKQRAGRRRRWYDIERPTLLVRLRLVAPAGIVDRYKDTPMRDKDGLRYAVYFYESHSPNPPTN